MLPEVFLLPTTGSYRRLADLVRLTRQGKGPRTRWGTQKTQPPHHEQGMTPLRLVLPQHLLREKRNLQGWPRTRRTYTGAGRSDVRDVLSPTSESRKLTKENAAGAA